MIDEVHRQLLFCFTERAPLRTHDQRLAGHQRGGGIPHRAPGDEAAFDHQFRLDAEEAGAPQHDVGNLAVFQRTDVLVDAKGLRSVDGVFGDVALDAFVVAEPGLFFRQPATLIFHLGS